MNIIKNYDTVIVGGGISGLAAAYYLTQKDQTHKIIILESSRQLGGKIQTDLLKTESGDFLLEKGPDSYVAYKKEATELARELNLESE